MAFATVILGTFVITSCSNEEETVEKSISNSNRRENINLDLIIKEYYRADYNFGSETYSEEYDIAVTEILISGHIVGYVTKNSSSLGLTDIRIFESDKKLKFLDIVEEKNYTFDLVYDEEFDALIPDFDGSFDYTPYADNRCKGQLILCTGLCTLSAAAIAASDGPLPFMDAVAATYWVGCQGKCVVDYDLCANP